MIFDTHTNLMWYPDHLSDEFVKFAWEAKKAKMKLSPDVHFAGSLIHATLCVAERYTQDEIQDLIEDLDEELLNAVGLSREDFIVHVHQGREVGVFSNREYSEDEEKPAEN